LSSRLFVCEELIKYNGTHDVFVNEKAGNSVLDRTFEATDSMNDTLDE
jgi:hypothetical protein